MAAEREAAKAGREAAKAEREREKKELQTLCEGEKRQTTIKMWKRTVEGYVPFVSMHTKLYYNNLKLSCSYETKNFDFFSW